LIQNLEDFEKTTAFPSQEDFYDKLSETHISNKDYADAKEIYEVSKCRHMKDLHDLYLMLDVSYLADTWRDFTYKIHKDFKVYPSNYTTGPSLFYACAMRKSGTPIRRLEDLGMYDRFNNGIKGGFTVVNKRHTVANCIEMGDKFDPNQPASSILFGDFNSLYGGTLRAPMPYDKMEFLDDARVEVYNKNPKEFLKIDTSDTAEIGYWATVDFTIPDALKEFTDDLPLGLVNSQAIYASDYTRSLGKAGEQKLIAGHFGLEQYGMHIKLLQFYIKLGVEITKVHDIIRFKQKPLFRPYIDHCLSKRAEASANNDPVQKRLYKLLANSLYGKCLQSDLKYNSTSVLVEIGERYSKLVGNPRFKSRKWIIPDKVALVSKSKAAIELRAPIFIGACVLQLAKLINYEFLLGVAKPSCADFPPAFEHIVKAEDLDLVRASRGFIQSIKMLYADTDSQMLHITYTESATEMSQDDLYKHTFLRKYLDRSNFKSLSKESSCQPGEIGYIKSELSDDVIHEAICLSPKCYSVLAYDRESNKEITKFAIKGCPIRLGGEVYSHKVFQEILHNANYPIPSVTANYIRRNGASECGISTIRQTKTCLSLLDNKRFWVSVNQSYGFGHPKTYDLGYKDTDIVAGSGSRIKALDQYGGVDFYEDFCSPESEYDNEDFFSESVQPDCSSESQHGDEGLSSEAALSDHLFFYGEAGDAPLVEVGDTYSTAVDDEYDLDLVYE